MNHLQAKRVSVGPDFCFGQKRSGTAVDLQAIASFYGIDVMIAPIRDLDGERISSSAIRQALLDGNLQLANHLLGDSYCLVGTVSQGQQLGRTLGFPTANLKLPPKNLYRNLAFMQFASSYRMNGPSSIWLKLLCIRE